MLRYFPTRIGGGIDMESTSDYLCHYGVLGMKWGIHKAKAYAKSANRIAAKKGDDPKAMAKAEKRRAKSARIEQKHRDRGGSKTYDRVANIRTAVLYGQSLMLGTYGALNYQRARANGDTVGRGLLDGFVSGVANQMTSGLLGIIEPRVTQSGEKKARKREAKAAQQEASSEAETSTNPRKSRHHSTD